MICKIDIEQILIYHSDSSLNYNIQDEIVDKLELVALFPKAFPCFEDSIRVVKVSSFLLFYFFAGSAKGLVLLVNKL